MILAIVLISIYALLATIAIVLIVKKVNLRVASMFDYNNIVRKRISSLYFDVNGFLLSDNDSSNSEHVLGSLHTGDNISEYKDNPDMATYLRTCVRHRRNLSYKVEEKVDDNLVKRADLIFLPFISNGELQGVSVVSQIMYSKNREAELIEKARGLADKNQEAQRQIERLDAERGNLELAFKKSSKHHLQLQKAMYRIELQKQELEKALDIINRQKEELERVNKEISRSNQMKEVFLANTSHEIRTPLNAIIGFTNLLLKMSPDGQQLKYLNNIKTSGKNLLFIINDILDLSKIEAGKMQLEDVNFDFRAMISECVDALSVKRGDKEISISIDIAETVPTIVTGDPLRINQILTNLLNNSIKFTGNDCIISLKVILISSTDDNVNLGFEVSDNGIGIPKERQSEIFESFTQANTDTTRKYGGTGLGLSITRQLVEMYGGTITVESELDRGSTFKFNLILKRSELTAIVQSETVSLQSSDAKLHILLVEDNEINQQLAIDTLKAWNQNVEIDIAGNGQIAVEKAGETLYDVVLMDIQMPVMDGNAAARAIRGMTEPNCNVPIIAMTAHAFKEERERCLSNGMNDYVMKPFVPEDLCAKICKYAGISRKDGERSAERKKSDCSGDNFDLSMLVEACAGQWGELRRVLDVYASSVTSDIADLEAAQKKGDGEVVRMKKHALQTAFSYLGMIKAYDAVSQIDVDCATPKELIGFVVDEWQHTLPQIREVVDKKTGSTD